MQQSCNNEDNFECFDKNHILKLATFLKKTQLNLDEKNHRRTISQIFALSLLTTYKRKTALSSTIEVFKNIKG